MSLVLIECLMHPRHYRARRVRILVEQISQYLKMLLDEEAYSVLVLLLLEAEVKQLEFFQLLQNEAPLQGLLVAALIRGEQGDPTFIGVDFT